MQKRLVLVVVLSLAWLAGNSLLLSAQRPSGRYAVILSEPPATQQFAGVNLKSMRHTAALDYRQHLQQAQATVRQAIEQRNIRVTGSVQLLLNAVFVQASEIQAAELRNLPGVQGVVPLARLHLSLNKAVPLVNGPGAWNELGGVQNAGAGMKIAIIDTGIDQTHPAFQDVSLSVPSGFPKCQGADCAFTNNKVIVARSYVRQLGAGSPPDPAAESRPDDYSPRDRVGHGTATAMIAAGETNTGPAATITGMAPKAWLGNYKVFGSPGVNDGTTGDVVISALEDALTDGMDVASLSLGGPAFSGPLDQGAACGQSAGTPCDPEAVAVENAVQAGMTVVVAAGNEGDTGLRVPTLNTISSPATAPSAIAVGATTNSHVFTSSVRVPGTDVPSDLQSINALFGGGAVPSAPLTAPVRDVTQLGNDGLACSALPPGSLNGAIALVQRGTCLFLTKVTNAQNAGAVGVLIYQSGGVDSIFSPGGLSGTPIPAVMIGNTDGLALKSYLASHSSADVTLDPGFLEADTSTFNTVASFTSRGPSIASGPVKPDLVAVGTDMYMATETYDPNGDMYDPSGYTVADGTSFSTPMVAGAAALVKQMHPGFGPAQVKSAMINTATQDVTEGASTASSISVGAGKLEAGAALQPTVTVQPPTVYFGKVGSGALPLNRQLVLTNSGAGAASLNLAVTVLTGDSKVQVTLDKTSLSLNPGQSGTVTLALSGSISAAGIFEGAVTIQGGGAALRVPYQYLVGDGFPYNLVPLIGSNFDGPVGEAPTTGGLAIKLIDDVGAPIAGVPVAFGVSFGGGSVQSADSVTDTNGIAGANVKLGPNAGAQEFVARAGGLTTVFDGIALARPTISAGGVVNAASFDAGAGIVPGAYIAVFGTALSGIAQAADSASLPLAINSVSVSFDVPSAGLSLPGHLYYVSPGQVNVQVPWELAGQSSVEMKVSIGDVSGVVYTAPVAQYAPAVFEYTESSGNLRLAAALDENYQLIGSANAARRGHSIQLYMNGLGPVDNQPASGEPAPTQPLSQTLAQPVVTVGGKDATVEFSGLTPTLSGLYQVNVVVPPDAPAGVQPVTVSIGGVPAKTSQLPIQ